MENQLNLFSLTEQNLESSFDGKAKNLSTHESKEDIKGDLHNTAVIQIKYGSLEEAKVAALICTKCALCKGRTNVVFSDGSVSSKIMIIGEGPGENEDLKGLPFVGRAGQLLDKIFASVDLNRKEHLYICNIVKCRPPNNRAPLDEEASVCLEYLEAQIKYVDPKIIILAGAVAVKGILKLKDPKITKLRGKWIDDGKGLLSGRKFMPIFHPSYLLRHEWNKNPDSPKALMWQDIKEIKRVYESLS